MTCLALILSLLVAAPRLVNYSAADGLTSNTVYAIVQDTDGILWAGTRNTVDSYKERIKGKLGLDSPVECVAYAVKNGIVAV